jgi:hypothetical protein
MAVKMAVSPAFATEVAGEMLNVTGWVLIVTVADAETAGLPTKLAVTVTVPPSGNTAGAT